MELTPRAPSRLAVAAPGLVDYHRALAWQEALVRTRSSGGPDALLLLEHPPVYTLGRGADRLHLRQAEVSGVPVVRVGRGGEVTYHGPGQLVGYPILDLRALRPDVHWYLRRLEDVLIATLEGLGIAAGRLPGKTGVWVGGRKIASIGVGVRRWVTWHGFALNVSDCLDGFAAITPCGIAGVEMTTIEREGGPREMAEIVSRVLASFVAGFGYTEVEPLACSEDETMVRP